MWLSAQLAFHECHLNLIKHFNWQNILCFHRLNNDGLQQHSRIDDKLKRLKFAPWSNVKDPHRSTRPAAHRKSQQSHPRASAVLLLRLLVAGWPRVRHRLLRFECREGKWSRFKGTSGRRSDNTSGWNHRKLSSRWRSAQRAVAIYHQSGSGDDESSRWVMTNLVSLVRSWNCWIDSTTINQ